jgi:ketosteroid isomerase-like protein
MQPHARLETDEREVLMANQAFYQALQSLDLAKMDAAWWHEEWVRCLHPGWELITGWEEVRESWASIFGSTARMRIVVSRPLVHVVGDTAWVSCVENVTTTYEGGFETALIESTNIYVRRGGEWRLAHHHTSPLPERVPEGTSRSVQ